MVSSDAIVIYMYSIANAIINEERLGRKIIKINLT